MIAEHCARGGEIFSGTKPVVASVDANRFGIFPELREQRRVISMGRGMMPRL